MLSDRLLSDATKQNIQRVYEVSQRVDPPIQRMEANRGTHEYHGMGNLDESVLCCMLKCLSLPCLICLNF
jgi:hypothetical protein